MQAALIFGAVDTLVTFSAFLAARSSVILADFLKTVLEFVAVLLAWYTVRRMRQGADHRYQYGIGKLEHLTSLGVGVLMFICLLVIVGNAVRNIMNPGHIAGIGVWISLGAQFCYGIINTTLFVRTDRMARQESSPLMASQARLLLSRAVGNLFIFAALVLSMTLHGHGWALYIDPVASLIVATFILLSALGIFSSSIDDLLDRALEEESQIIIMRELVKSFHDYEEIHGIRTRRAGKQVFIEIFLEFAGDKTVADVQPVIDRISANLEQAIPGSHVVVVMTTRKVN